MFLSHIAGRRCRADMLTCFLLTAVGIFGQSQTTVSTPDGTGPPVTTVPDTNSFTTVFPSATPSIIGSIPPNAPLSHLSVLAILLAVIILLCVITSVVIFYLLRVRRQRLLQQPSVPYPKTPLTPSKIQLCQVIEVPERVTNDGTMIDIRSPWSPINPRKLDVPLGAGADTGRNHLPILQRDQSGYFRSMQ